MVAMKILGQPVSDMYIWSIALLLALAAISGNTLHIFPTELLVAAGVSGSAEILIRKAYLNHNFKIPWSGIITGLLIGAIAPINSPLLLVALASIAAIASKFFIQYKKTNIFNPAAAGLLIALPIFGLGDEWWIASNYSILGMAITLTPVLIILAYKARRMYASLSFVAMSIILDIWLTGMASLSSIPVMLFGINYIFAFVMMIEPKTSPNNRYAQIAYGGGLSLLLIIFASLNVPYSFLAVLLAGNAVYAIYRLHGKR